MAVPSRVAKARSNAMGVVPEMKANAKVLLVTLKAAPGFNIAPSIGIHQLQQYLEQRGIGCEVLDREFEDEEPYVEKARNGAYAVIGLSVSHLHMTVDLTLLWRFRMAVEEGGGKCVFVAGGQEATMNARQWLELGVDLIFKGFAEKTLFSFCERLDGDSLVFGKPIDLAGLADGIPGIAYLDGEGELVSVAAPPLTREVFRELCFEQVLTNDVPYHKYWDRVRDDSADTTLGAADFFVENVRVYTTSHCPRKCGFCNSQSFLPWSQDASMPIIQLTAEEVVGLIVMYVDRYGARSFLFSDDDFPVGNRAGLARVGEICHRVIELKESGRIPGDIRFSCQARIADFLLRDGYKRKVVNRDLLALMARAGFMSFGLGVETWSDRILKVPSIYKLGIELSDCRDVIEAMLELGLVPQINLILGIPEYTVDELATTMEAAIDFILDGCDIAMTKLMWAWPGAPLHEGGAYPMTYKKWTNPWTGQEALISDYFIPHDPKIARIIERFDRAAAAELKEAVKRRDWNGKIVHKRVVNLTGFIAIAKLIERTDIAERYEKLLDDVISRGLN